MLTLVIGSYGLWILPIALSVRLVHRPFDVPLRVWLSFPLPKLRGRGIRIRELMVLVVLMSLDCSITLATLPVEIASVLTISDVVVILIPVLIALFVSLTPMLFTILTVTLAFVALREIRPYLGDP
jgi:hypothetical protein